jgi:poly(ADP-ribose) glycohydrolase
MILNIKCLYVRKFGGGVLDTGSVQEEILLLEYTESLVGLLLLEELGDDEAAMISGIRRYNDVKGYASSMKWKELNEEKHLPRRVILAMDAVCFGRDKGIQYTKIMMERELIKAYTAFSLVDDAVIGTGNWGCGVFNVSCSTIL